MKKNQKLGKKEYIDSYFKTAHFLYRQWDRKVTDELIHYVLQKIQHQEGKRVIILSRQLVKQFDERNEEFFLLIRNKVLITCYFTNINEFMGKKSARTYTLIGQHQSIKKIEH